MKYKIIACIILLFLAIKPSSAYAGDPDNMVGPPIEEVLDFIPFPVEVLTDGKYKVGILMSENEYTFYTKLKGSYNLLNDRLKIFQEAEEANSELIQTNIDNTLKVSKDLQDLKNTIVYESFFDKYKFPIGIGIGVLTTVLTVIVIEKVK